MKTYYSLQITSTASTKPVNQNNKYLIAAIFILYTTLTYRCFNFIVTQRNNILGRSINPDINFQLLLAAHLITLHYYRQYLLNN